MKYGGANSQYCEDVRAYNSLQDLQLPMTIPEFDPITGVIPPHLGNPTSPDQITPYECTIEEFCGHFATSAERVVILEGLLKYRESLRNAGITGFQWIDGSFTEDIELIERRHPKDVDVVTFAEVPTDRAAERKLLADHPNLFDPFQVKQQFSVDGFIVPLNRTARVVVSFTRYWTGLFSHRRDQTWKGMLQVELTSFSDDQAARQILLSKMS